MKIMLLLCLIFFVIACGAEKEEQDHDFYVKESDTFYRSCLKKEEAYCCMTKLRYYQYTFLGSNDFITSSEVRVVCVGSDE